MIELYVPTYGSDFSRRELLSLADTLSIDPKQAVGTWIALNLWCQSNAPTGSIAGLKPSTLAIAVGMPPNQGNHLLAALKTSGLIDDTGHLLDWNLYGGRILEHRRKKAQSMQRTRANSGNSGTTVAPHNGNRGRPVATPVKKEKVKGEDLSTRDSNGAGGADSPAPADYAWVNALVPGAIAAAAEARAFEEIFQTRPDIDHTYELRTMYLKMHHPSRNRSWAEQYASWIRDGKSHKLLPAHQRTPDNDERNRLQELAQAMTREQYEELRATGYRTDDEFQLLRLNSSRFHDS